jgi:putative membrane protein
MYGPGYWGFGYCPFDMFFRIIFWVLVVFGIGYLIKTFSKEPPRESGKKQDEAMDILRKRYASGEINAEEFAQKKKDLES